MGLVKRFGFIITVGWWNLESHTVNYDFNTHKLVCVRYKQIFHSPDGTDALELFHKISKISDWLEYFLKLINEI